MTTFVANTTSSNWDFNIFTGTSPGYLLSSMNYFINASLLSHCFCSFRYALYLRTVGNSISRHKSHCIMTLLKILDGFRLHRQKNLTTHSLHKFQPHWRSFCSLTHSSQSEDSCYCSLHMESITPHCPADISSKVP